jgi:glyoxylase-like metal-dependent hydrolase (beta-lactamase superfamily II)
MSAVFERVGAGVVAIDTEYGRPRMDAAHLIVDGGRAAFVDAGTHYSVPNMLAALAAEDLDVEAVEYVLLTHIHLDHAGGAGELAAALPRARVLVHPRGAAHMVDPSILIAATKAVYGAEKYAELYGDIIAIPAERVASVEDGQRIKLGARTLEFVYTPGHALHHLCIVDRDAGEVFTGDTFGLSYRELDTAAGEFIFPTTSPSQFDPQQLHASITRVVEFKPTAAYLTHYSRVGRVDELALDLHADIDAFVRIAQSVAQELDRVPRMRALLFDYLSARLDAHGFSDDAAQRHAILDGDIALNAAGLHSWLSRRTA